MSVKDIIREKRLELGMTMKEVADKVGVSEATISRWESGEIENMRRGAISSLAKALHISPNEIMGWESPSASNEIPTVSPRGRRLMHAPAASSKKSLKTMISPTTASSSTPRTKRKYAKR